jgi:hypothetical protein
VADVHSGVVLREFEVEGMKLSAKSLFLGMFSVFGG